jgi:hypothetical protein
MSDNGLDQRGLVGMGLRAQSAARNLRAFTDANKRRVCCKKCRNLVLPEKMAQHIRIYHP